MYGEWQRFKEWHAHLKAIDIFVVVVKARNIQIEMRREQYAVPSLIAQQYFGTELAVAIDLQVNGQRCHGREVRELNVPHR